MPAPSRVWPDPRVKPPYGTAELDRSQSLANQLIAAYLLQGTGTAIDSVGPNTLPALGSVPYIASASGLAIQIRTAGYFVLSGNTWLSANRPSAYPVSIYARSAAATGNNGSNRGAVHMYDPTAAWMFRLGWAGESGTPLMYVGTSGLVGSDQGANVWTHLVGVAASTTSRSLWVNGLQASTASTSQSFLTPTNLRLSEGLAGDPFIDLATAYIWARALSASDIAWLASEPYAMFRPLVRRRYFVSAVAGSPTLTPPVGSAVFTPVGAARMQDFRLTPATA